MDQSNGNGPYVGKRLSSGTFVVDEAVLADYYGGLALDPPTSGLLPSTIASGPDGDYFREIAFANQTGASLDARGVGALGADGGRRGVRGRGRHLRHLRPAQPRRRRLPGPTQGR